MLIKDNNKNPVQLIISGHVDHGKSTLVGRLLHDSGLLTDGKMESIKAMSKRRGMPLEYAFLLDSLQAERDQGITIDVTKIPFKSAKRTYVIIDAPGHKEFLKNMITGAAQADGGVIVIDAAEGLQEQSRRHCYLLKLLGFSFVTVVVNKMDLVSYDDNIFEQITTKLTDYLNRIGMHAQNIVPISAREGEGLITSSELMAWYDGPTFLEAIDSIEQKEPLTGGPLRLPIQDIYKFDERRILVGRIETGSLSIGDTLLFSPSNKTANVSSFETWNETITQETLSAGRSVAFTLDEQIFVERGHIASDPKSPPFETNIFKARLFWLAEKPLVKSCRMTLKLTTAEYSVEIQSIERCINTQTLESVATNEIGRYEIGDVIIRSKETIVLDPYNVNTKTGRFVLVDQYETVGGGIISMEGYPNQRGRHNVVSTNIEAVASTINQKTRASVNGHTGGIIWLTGLSGAGKSTIAMEAERQLFQKGYQIYVLDGDNIRFGLSADLGFTPADRTENIRRIGEVAKLFADAGVVVITAFISPYRDDRNRVRAIAPDQFHEVFIKADLSTCETRDPKGLYAKARNGEIEDFTGVSAPYEEPTDANLIIDTGAQNIDQSVSKLLDYVSLNFKS